MLGQQGELERMAAQNKSLREERVCKICLGGNSIALNSFGLFGGHFWEIFWAFFDALEAICTGILTI